MADNEYINKVQMADGRVLMDLTEDTITENHILSGATAHICSGAPVIGSIPTYDGDYIVTNHT